MITYYDNNLHRYSDMAKTFADHVEYIPGGATLNAIKLAQVRLTTRSQNVCCIKVNIIFLPLHI